MNKDMVDFYLNKFFTLQKWRQIGFVAIFGVALFLLGLNYFVLNKIHELEIQRLLELEVRHQLEDKQNDLLKSMADIALLKQREHALILQQNLLIDEKSVSKLLEEISILGSKSGLKFKYFSTLDKVRMDPIFILPVKMQLTGKYQFVIEFLQQLIKLNLGIESFNIELFHPDKTTGIYLNSEDVQISILINILLT